VRNLAREVLDQYRGVAATADDPSVLATFDGPGRAVRCGRALVDRAAAANLHLSVGLHTAEVDRRGAAIWGDGVSVARDVAARAEWGEVWITPTVRALTEASDFSYDRRGSLELPSLKRSLELDAVR
jgi:class 3 adenylate cyclase